MAKKLDKQRKTWEEWYWFPVEIRRNPARRQEVSAWLACEAVAVVMKEETSTVANLYRAYGDKRNEEMHSEIKDDMKADNNGLVKEKLWKHWSRLEMLGEARVVAGQTSSLKMLIRKTIERWFENCFEVDGQTVTNPELWVKKSEYIDLQRRFIKADRQKQRHSS